MKNLGEVVIRPAAAEDEHGILHCLATAFGPYRDDYTPGAYSDTVLDKAALARRMQQMHLLVAASGTEIVGTVAGSCSEGEGYIRGMALLPECQGSGLAAALLAAIEDWLNTEGCRRIKLRTTLPLQAAIRFYEKNGYKKSERISDFFGMPLLEYVKALD